MSQAFGMELRRLRKLRGLTQAALAEATMFTKGHISHVETGARHPTRELAEHCDQVLEADGRLIDLLDHETTRPVISTPGIVGATAFPTPIHLINSLAAAADRLRDASKAFSEVLQLAIATTEEHPPHHAIEETLPISPGPLRVPAGMVMKLATPRDRAE
jgi:transcriptional regulator with XRE-family HTH domain